MRETIETLRKATDDFVFALDEKTYDQIQQFLLQREQLIARLVHHAWTEVERQAVAPHVRDILAQDAEILAHLDVLRRQYEGEYHKMQRWKQKQQLYASVGQERLYFDQRT